MVRRFPVQHREIIDRTKRPQMLWNRRPGRTGKLAAKPSVAQERVDLDMTRSAGEPIVFPVEERTGGPRHVIEGIGILNECGGARRLRKPLQGAKSSIPGTLTETRRAAPVRSGAYRDVCFMALSLLDRITPTMLRAVRWLFKSSGGLVLADLPECGGIRDRRAPSRSPAHG